MARRSYPWFRQFDGWWYVKLAGKQVKLAKGSENKDAAIARWHELVAEQAANPGVGNPEQTVASVIDLYLRHIQRYRSPRTFTECKRYTLVRRGPRVSLGARKQVDPSDAVD